MMRNIIGFLCFLILLSCKKTEEDVNENSGESIINKEWQGDIMISDLSFANSISAKCKVSGNFFERSEEQMKKDNAECVLSKIKFDYEKLESLKARVSAGKINSETEIFIKATKPKPVEGATLLHQATLYVEINKKVTDSMIVYHSINFDMALVVSERYYYLNENSIYVLDLFEDESGAGAKKWAEYKINTLGKIVLERQKVFSPENYDDSSEISENDLPVNNNRLWKGVFHFEGSGRDNKKTTFDITVDLLDDISFSITVDGIKNEYFNLKAEIIDDENIKINFDPSLDDDKGSIYIEKISDDFYFYGNSIYFSNPEGNRIRLDKTK